MRGDKEQFKKVFATVILVLLVGFVLYAVSPFLKAFFGAFIIFYLFNPIHKWLLKNGWDKRASAAFILVLVFLVIVVPLFFASKLMVHEVSSITIHKEAVEGVFSELDSLLQRFSIDVDSMTLVNRLPSLGVSATDFIISAVGNVVRLALNLIVFFFTLFFLLLESDNFFKKIKPYIPFSKKHTNELVEKFRDVSYATLVATGLLATLQGIAITLGFWIFGLKGAVLWGFMSMIFSFLPVLGIPMIYIPAGLISMLLNHNYVSSIGIIIWGAVVSLSENFIRPYMQRRMGKLHPLVTIVGVFFGVPMFGLLGIFVGPLLLSLALLVARIYVEEYA